MIKQTNVNPEGEISRKTATKQTKLSIRPRHPAIISISCLLLASSIGCGDELSYLKDEERYDCTGTVFPRDGSTESAGELSGRYIVNKKTGTVYESLRDGNKMNKLQLVSITNGQISAQSKLSIGGSALKIINNVTITTHLRPVGFYKYAGVTGRTVSWMGECSLVKLNRDEVLAGRKEYLASERSKTEWFKFCEKRLKENLKDPSSYQYISHRSIGNNKGGARYVDIFYRAKNSYGATVKQKYECVL